MAESRLFASELRRRLGPAPELPDPPSVSVVVINRNGANHMRRLLAGLANRTDYRSLELVVVDNGSSDDSLRFIRQVQAPFPISIVANAHNESFSDASNQGAEAASGELMLFLNNDTVPFESGWLRELVACQLASSPGMLGSTLVEPSPDAAFDCGFAIQQRGVGIFDDGGVLRASFRDFGADPLGDDFGEDVEAVGVSGACCLLERDLFERVGGFTHGYMYGAEDSDLALKVREQDRAVICSGRSFMIHLPGSTLSAVSSAERGEWQLNNRRLLLERWGSSIRREYEADLAADRGIWALDRAGVPALSRAPRSAPDRAGASDPPAKPPEDRHDNAKDDGLRALAEAIERRIGPPRHPRATPPVSMIVVNRDGVDHLRRLISGLISHTDYPNFDLIVVDNGSSDDSMHFVTTLDTPFAVSAIRNFHNESFSDASNQGAAAADGDLLLFVNNDVELFDDRWLAELVDCLESSGAGAVAGTLLCSDDEHATRFEHGYGVQHRGLGFRDEEGLIQPVLHGWGADPLDARLGLDAERPAAAAACLLLRRTVFDQIGGFTHGYVYGCEDVDLSLKLRAVGLPVVCSGRSIAVHHPASTRRTKPFRAERERKLRNRQVLWERWGPLLRREHDLDLLSRTGLWAEESPQPQTGMPSREEVASLGFCLKADGTHAAVVDGEIPEVVERLRTGFRRRGYRCMALLGEAAEDSLAFNYDVAIHLRETARYVPRKAQLNVLLALGDHEGLTATEAASYDLIVSGSGRLGKRLRDQGMSTPVAMLDDRRDDLAEVLLEATAARAEQIGLKTRFQAGVG